MQTLIYLSSEDANTDHCENCGGEEHENNTGKLQTYLIVEVQDSAILFPKATAEYEVLCARCAFEMSEA